MVGGEEHGDFESRTGCVEQLHGRRSPADKETWWWNDKVQHVIKARNIWENQDGRKADIATDRQTRRQRKQ